MVALHPSRSVKDETDIDFNILSQCFNLAFELIYKRKFSVALRIHKSRKGFDYYLTNNPKPTIYLHLPSTPPRSLYSLIGSIVHESRHWQQEKILKVDFNDNEIYAQDWANSIYRYVNSPVEKDARQFQRVTTVIVQMYLALIKLRRQNEQYKFHKGHNALRKGAG